MFKDREAKRGEMLKSLILFAKEQGIPRFRYHGFEFDLSAPNPNQEELETIKQNLKDLTNVVNNLALKEGFRKVG